MKENTITRKFIVTEFDMASASSYLRGKDGRLYRKRDVIEAEARAAKGDAAALAALAKIDFAVGEDGAPLDEEAAHAAMIANRDAWMRGDFDHLRRIAELEPRAGRKLSWAQRSREKRELSNEHHRDRADNSSLQMASLDDVSSMSAAAGQPAPDVPANPVVMSRRRDFNFGRTAAFGR